MALKGPTNQSQSAINAPVILDVWFEEGNLTVASAKTISRGNVMMDRPTYTWVSRVDFADNPQAPDFVTTAPTDAEYTYVKLQGKPIMVLNTAVTSGTANVVGVLGSDLHGPVRIPSSSQTSVANRVAGLYLRHGQVTLFGCVYYPIPVETTSANITVGDHLVYDRSDALWKKESGTTLSPVIACHAATDNTGQYVGALFYGCPNSQT